MTASTLRAGRGIAAEHPSLILWYLENRLRTTLLPLERRRRTAAACRPGSSR